jgi:hypothetical protein
MKRLLFSFLLFCSAAVCAQSSGGMFLPVATSTSVFINPIPQAAQYIRADSVVIVYGSIFLNGTPTVGIPVFITVTVPIPVMFAGGNNTARGFANVFQSGAPVVVSQVTTTPAEVQIKYTPTAPFPANMVYHYSYVIHIP